jgi:hypothetical protein
MAKSTFNGKQKQDQVYAQFQRIIRMEKYAEPTLVERIIEESRIRKEKFEREKAKRQTEQVFRSFHNPDSPLRGSSSWSKQQWAEYRERQRAEKRAAKK